MIEFMEGGKIICTCVKCGLRFWADAVNVRPWNAGLAMRALYSEFPHLMPYDVLRVDLHCPEHRIETNV